MAKVRDLMVTGANCLPSSSPIIEIAHQMKVSGRDVVPICERGRFLGLITERDIVIGIVANLLDPVTVTAKSLMRRRQPVLAPNDDIRRAAKLMTGNRIRVLPVVQCGELLGMFTLENLVQVNTNLPFIVLSDITKSQMNSEKKKRE